MLERFDLRGIFTNLGPSTFLFLTLCSVDWTFGTVLWHVEEFHTARLICWAEIFALFPGIRRSRSNSLFVTLTCWKVSNREGDLWHVILSPSLIPIQVSDTYYSVPRHVGRFRVVCGTHQMGMLPHSSCPCWSVSRSLVGSLTCWKVLTDVIDSSYGDSSISSWFHWGRLNVQFVSLTCWRDSICVGFLPIWDLVLSCFWLSVRWIRRLVRFSDMLESSILRVWFAEQRFSLCFTGFVEVGQTLCSLLWHVGRFRIERAIYDTLSCPLPSSPFKWVTRITRFLDMLEGSEWFVELIRWGCSITHLVPVEVFRDRWLVLWHVGKFLLTWTIH